MEISEAFLLGYWGVENPILRAYIGPPGCQQSEGSEEAEERTPSITSHAAIEIKTAVAKLDHPTVSLISSERDTPQYQSIYLHYNRH